MKDTLIRILPYVAIAILAWLLMRGCDQQKADRLLQEAVQDTLRTTRNKLGQQQAKISILATASKKDFLKLKTKDSTILKLQGLVKKFKGKIQSATVLSNITSITGTGATNVVARDTMVINDTVYIYQEYSDTFDEKWSSGVIIANKDSISRDIKVRNEFEITNGWTKRKLKNLFKDPPLEVSVLNLNPNTETTELRTFTVQPPNKRFSVSVQAGYGVLLNGFSVGTGFYLGAGVSFNVIKF